jgi:ergothioneine biosynthesis protein EgtB
VTKEQIRQSLSDCRAKTIGLLGQVPDEFLRRRVHSFYSPIGWHFGHVGRTEEFWVVGEALGRPLLDDHLSFLFADLADNPKDNRVNIPDRAGIIEYLEKTRSLVLEALEGAELESESPYLANGYAWAFALQHECQHQETIAEMLQLIQRDIGARAFEPIPWRTYHRQKMIPISGGTYLMGSSEPSYYDNEQDAHPVDVSSFELAQTPVTAFEWTEFMMDGGYANREWWSEEGWTWRVGENAQEPEYWIRQEDSWGYFGPYGVRAIHPDEPASCISWFEAEAYANWAGKRLPTEEEWELARRQGVLDVGLTFNGSDVAPIEQPFALICANHGQEKQGPRPVTIGTPDTLGLLDMAGNVWEWTSSKFLPYPGFRAFPYDGYSKDHMKGAHRVCRGGSWATAMPILRPTFRNWYVPTYRQGFLGVRLAG